MIKRKIARTAQYVVLLMASFVALYPLWIVFNTSLKTKGEFNANPFGLARSFNFDNFVRVFEQADIPIAFFNSVVITLISVIIQIFLGTMAAYALTKVRFKRAGFFSVFFLAPMIFPIQTVFVPLYLMFLKLNLINTYQGVIIIYSATGLPLVVFMFNSFMRTIPLQISEAAMIDGAKHFTIYTRMIMPLSRPVVATAVIINSLTVWNDFFLTNVMLSRREMRTLPLAIYNFTGVYSSNWPLIFTCIIYVVLPIIILYLLLQKHIINGVVAGAIKG